MKKMFLLSMIIAGGMIFQSAEAQIKISAQININSQPDWGPSGYNYAQYYYMPDANMYYDIATRQYIYQERGRWVNVSILPAALRKFDLYKSYKVVINDRTPWLHNDRYRKQYSGNRNRLPQTTWRDIHNNGRQEMARNDHRNSNHGMPDRTRQGNYGHNGYRH